MAGESPNPQEPTNGLPAAGTADANSGQSSAAKLAEDALDAASAAANTIQSETAAAPLNLQNFNSNGGKAEPAQTGLSLLDDVTLNVKIELGRTRMYVEDVLRLNENSVVELDKAAGDPVDIYVNDRHVARGEVLVLNENFCVRVSEIVQQPQLDD
jgi:flagellar motor switch protein FliN/FliY